MESLKYLCFLFSFIALESYCQQPIDSAKFRYTIFHPTPEKLMRDLETDRPDATESPFTLDAGHFQFETDLFKTEKTSIDGIKTINNYYNAFNLKLGVTNSLDMQFVVVTFSTLSIKKPGNIEKVSNFGSELTIRAKQNLWGNDMGRTAFAILPFVNIPITSSDKFSGGIIFPFGMSLSKGWTLGTQIETDLVYNHDLNNYGLEILFSVTTSHSINENFDFFIEGFATRNIDIKIYEYFLNSGLVYKLTKNINIDCGTYLGIKHISSKTYFVGLSFRI